jgi:hypothetical protein
MERRFYSCAARAPRTWHGLRRHGGDERKRVEGLPCREAEDRQARDRAQKRQAHVAPIWFDLDDNGTILFMTGIRTAKGHAIHRDPQVCLCVDDETPPFSFVMIDGEVTWITADPDEMLPWSVRIAARYMEPTRARRTGGATRCRARCWCGSPPRTWWPRRQPRLTLRFGRFVSGAPGWAENCSLREKNPDQPRTAVVQQGASRWAAARPSRGRGSRAPVAGRRSRHTSAPSR